MSPDFSSLVHWILFLPLGAALFIALFLRRAGAVAAWLSTGVAFAIAALALRLLTAAHDLGWLAAGKGATMQVLCIECSMAGSPRPTAARQTEGLAAKLVQSSSGSGR